MFTRPYARTLRRRLAEPRRFIQVVAGARQVGKTTLVRQVTDGLTCPVHNASADDPLLRDRGWLEQQWSRARDQSSRGGDRAVLVLDEIQKIPAWSETVKRLWDEDTASGLELHVVILGSAPLLVGRGLTESLAGRFEVIRLPHWSFAEMRDAFGVSIEEYVFHGGYPGAAPLRDDAERWRRYVLESLIETTVSRDVLLLAPIDKPVLLRRLLELGCRYSGQVLSFNKMLGQLHDAGNTTTLAHYLELLDGAGMLAGLQKFAGQAVRARASSPKLQVHNTALMTAPSGLDLDTARRDGEYWGRLVESAVGAHLVAAAVAGPVEVFYWRERGREVDFVVRSGRSLLALEVKSGRAREGSRPGMDAFAARWAPARTMVVGAGGMSLEGFLSHPVEHWMD